MHPRYDASSTLPQRPEALCNSNEKAFTETRSKPQILLVEDEVPHAALLQASIADLAESIDHAQTGAEAFAALSSKKFDLVILDIGLPDVNGFEVQRWIRDLPSPPPVLFVTAEESVEKGVEAMRQGAANYVVKRADYLTTVTDAVTEILRDSFPSPLHASLFRVRARAESGETTSQLVGQSEAMQNVRRLVEVYSATDATLLIYGETGTGKDVVARMIHAESARKEGPFVAVNCAAIPDALMESEFFGSRRGSFTGSVRDREGFFAEAHRGTLFLDEIGELPLHLQSKLLRVIESGAYRSIGASSETSVDIRIVAATNRNLKDQVDEGAFRADLYYRLNVLRIAIPALRERRSDIPLLADFFIKKYVSDGNAPNLTPEAIEQLMAASWPGNVRELKHVVQRTLVHWRGGPIYAFAIDEADTPVVTSTFKDPPISQAALIMELSRHRGRLGPVAAALGVSTRTIQRRICEFGLHLKDFRALKY